MHGLGRMEWPDGRFYQGNFSLDQRHGYGIYKFTDGSSFKGEFKDNKYHGTGSFTCVDGQVLTGLWSEGIIVKSKEIGNTSNDYGLN